MTMSSSISEAESAKGAGSMNSTSGA
jgi:hypothetical protein